MARYAALTLPTGLKLWPVRSALGRLGSPERTVRTVVAHVHGRESARPQSRSRQVRHLRRDRRRAGGGALVLSCRRGGRHDRQEHLRLRHDRLGRLYGAAPAATSAASAWRRCSSYEFTTLTEHLTPGSAAKRPASSPSPTPSPPELHPHRTMAGAGWRPFQQRPQSPAPALPDHPARHLLDRGRPAQQEAIGILGVNLIHAALFHHHDPLGLIGGLMYHHADELSAVEPTERSSPPPAEPVANGAAHDELEVTPAEPRQLFGEQRHALAPRARHARDVGAPEPARGNKASYSWRSLSWMSR